jgi:hypothetical protein
MSVNAFGVIFTAVAPPGLGGRRRGPRECETVRLLSASEPGINLKIDEGMKILSFLFPGFTALDLIGPTTVWGLMPGTEFQTVARESGPVKVDMASRLSRLTATPHEQIAGSAPAMAGGKPELLELPVLPAA